VNYCCLTGDWYFELFVLYFVCSFLPMKNISSFTIDAGVLNLGVPK
jgi:hypothetical protein